MHVHECLAALSDSALDLAGSKAAGAHMHSLLRAIDVNSDLLDVGIPDSVGSSMRMADVISKMSALAADITFCHLKHLLTYIFGSATLVYYQKRELNARKKSVKYNVFIITLSCEFFLRSFLKLFSYVLFLRS